jgi:phage protein D
MVQSGESDWAFLVKCANYLGYSVAMEKTMLHIWDPHKALGHKKSFAVLKTIAGTSGNVTPNVGQVLRFDGRIGKVTTSAERTQERIHMVSTDGQLLTVESSLEDTTSGLGMPVTSQFDHTVAINTTDYEMARKVLEGNLRRAFPFTAVVDITGDPTIKPGGVVYLSKYNSNFDGYWYVRSVRHEITRSELVSILELAKDGTNETDYTINPVVQYSQPPASALLNQQWLAEREYINIYE